MLLYFNYVVGVRVMCPFLTVRWVGLQSMAVSCHNLLHSSARTVRALNLKKCFSRTVADILVPITLKQDEIS